AKHVLLDAESVNVIDTTACDALLNLVQELQSQGISFAFARVRDEVRERMRLGGVEAAVGSTNFHERVTDGVRAWQQHAAPDGVSSGKSRRVLTYSCCSWLLASASALRFSSVTSGNLRSSDRIAVVITSATTARVTHLLSAGTTYQGPSSVVVAASASSYASM